MYDYRLLSGRREHLASVARVWFREGWLSAFKCAGRERLSVETTRGGQGTAVQVGATLQRALSDQPNAKEGTIGW
jgi:hypothetical protein